MKRVYLLLTLVVALLLIGATPALAQWGWGNMYGGTYYYPGYVVPSTPYYSYRYNYAPYGGYNYSYRYSYPSYGYYNYGYPSYGYYYNYPSYGYRYW